MTHPHSSPWSLVSRVSAPDGYSTIKAQQYAAVLKQRAFNYHICTYDAPRVSDLLRSKANSKQGKADSQDINKHTLPHVPSYDLALAANKS